MAFTIKYDGDAAFLLGAAVATLANDPLGCLWNVEVALYDGETVEGVLTDVQRKPGQIGTYVSDVVVTEADPETYAPREGGWTRVIDLDDVETLTIP